MNPMDLLMGQLENTTHRNPPQWEQHQKAIKARTPKAKDRRRRKDDVKHVKYLDVQQQVEVLVDLATDPNVLGRQWWGASMWI